MSGNKPPYIIPTMKEINSLEWNGYNVVSTFSGCGGSSLGYKMANFHVVWANEFIPAAQETYRANHKTTYLNCNDIRTVTVDDVVRESGLKVGEIDVLDGSPPCSAFSTAGKREKGWGVVKNYSDTKQRVDDLFFEYARLLKGLQPKVFIAENVSGLVKGVAKGYFKDIISTLKDCGYLVSARVLDASYLNVPTMRKRLIFVGVRKGLGLQPVHPVPLPYQRVLEEAIPEIYEDRPYDVKELGMAECITKEWYNIEVGGKSNKYLSECRAHPKRPCPTITQMGCQAAGVTHPFQPRRFSIDELKRISSFPSDFILTGTYKQQYERIGRAVPPLLMKAVAKTVQIEILDKLKKE